jgi:hypothetical protein
MSGVEDNSNLFELQNDLLIGNYQAVVSGAESTTATSDKCDKHRSHLFQTTILNSNGIRSHLLTLTLTLTLNH